MRTALFLLLLAGSLSVCGQPRRAEMTAARQVIERTFPQWAERLKLEPADKREGCDVFEQHIDGKQRLTVKASSGVALCKGVYDFLRRNGLGIYSWSGTRETLPNTHGQLLTRQVVSPFAHHYYFNVVTYGYSMPYWDWKRWKQEIDWMALHGIDMPLALVANEAISVRVWKRLGLTDEETAAYFVGPAHLPWMRMGNISGIDGPLPQQWHQRTIDLQHRILERMRSLGMTPICPGFAGFVPQALQRLYPDVKLTETSWGGAFHNWMLSPEDGLFSLIGKMFIEEWEKEFGKNSHYIVDNFNEMDIPFPPKEDPRRYELLASYGERVYHSIRAGNPDAVWVMQGWMFGYQRHIWDYRTLQALVSRVPDDKMLLLDLAVDYNKCFWNSEVNWEFYKGFYNKPWVYSVIPNMGGKSGMTGVLPFYANGHLEAIASSNRGRLTAFGMAPEGIENNEVIYELLSDAGWSNEEIDVEKWLENYSLSRYGKYTPALQTFWKGMQASVYGSFTDHPRYCWQFRPGTVRKGSIAATPAFYTAIESLTTAADELKDSPLFQTDFREWTAAYLGGKLEELCAQIEEAYLLEEPAKAQPLEERFVRWMEGADRLLSGHPTHRLERWIAMARKCADGNESLADYYERNARRIVTIWGPPVDDYSARIWSGLLRDYYLPRWQHYFEQKRTGIKFDFATWERRWVEQQKGLSPVRPLPDGVAEAVSLLTDASAFSATGSWSSSIVGSWQKSDLQEGENTFEWTIPVNLLRNAKGLRLSCYPSGQRIRIDQLTLNGDGTDYPLCPSPQQLSVPWSCPLRLPESFSGNNRCSIRLTLSIQGKDFSAGRLELLAE